MPFRRSLMVVLLFASVSLGADTLRTLDGREITGDIVSISEKEIVIRSQGKDQTIPTVQVLQVDVGPTGKLTGTKYIDVELTDGTMLHCAQVSFKNKEVQLTLLSGQVVKISIDLLAWMLNDAHDENIQKQWKEKRAEKRSSDLLVGLKDGQLTTFKGTIGDADAEGKQIKFDLDSKGEFRALDMSRVQGLMFLRSVDPNLPSTICTIFDTTTNAVAAAKVEVTETGFQVVTPGGAKIEYTKKLIARFDYNTGKLRYLSDVKPTKQIVQTIQANDFDKDPVLDKNRLKQPIRLGNQSYFKGLTLHATTVLEYQLDGEYREFKAMLGVDHTSFESQATANPTLIKIEGDDKELFSATISLATPPKEIKFNVKDVQKLRITVSIPPGETFDDGREVTLADPKISK